jgi:hypothetical protein
LTSEADVKQAVPDRASSSGKREEARILIACMPKSGSTFLSDVIAALPDISRARLVPLYGRREQELDESCILRAGRGPYVAQHHVRRSAWTEAACSKYGLRPVVLVRSLFDVVVSVRDHLRREGTESAMFYAEAAHAALNDATLEDMIARLAAPWYVNFYMSWRGATDALMISYEELIASPASVVGEVLAFAGAEIDDRAIAKALAVVRDRRTSRFNVGVVGRGAALRPETIRSLVTLFDFYPEAADDPYVKGVRAQAAAVLADSSPRPLGRVALHAFESGPIAAERPRGMSRLLKSARRYGYQITLITLGLLYWIWPEDLIPDDKWYGRIDDVVILTLLAFLAGRVTKRAPGLSDLPGRVTRAVRRRFRLNG